MQTSSRRTQLKNNTMCKTQQVGRMRKDIARARYRLTKTGSHYMNMHAVQDFESTDMDYASGHSNKTETTAAGLAVINIVLQSDGSNGVYVCGSSTILHAAPENRHANASSYFVRGKRCVMTGEMSILQDQTQT